MVLTVTCLAAFLLLSFRFCNKKGKDRLSHAAEGSAFHLFQCHNRWRISTGHKVDPIGFPHVLINSPMAISSPPFQLMELLKVALHIFHRAWNSSDHSLIGRESI